MILARAPIPPKKNRPERGRGGIPPTPPFRRARAEAKPRRSARSEQKPAKKFCFPFRRKNLARANKKL